MEKQLIRHDSDKVITGVCGGIANYFNINPTVVRIVAAGATFATGLWPGVIAYGIASVVMPNSSFVGRVEDDDIIIGEYEKHP